MGNDVATQNQNGYQVATLGEGEVWVRRTRQGDIKAVKATLTLREDQGELAVIEGKPMVAADGYYRANQITSLAILTPDSIKIPWEEGARDVPNPFPIIDEASGTQRGVWAKKIVVGYGPIGNLAVSSHTMFYNFTTYFLQDLQKKVQNNKQAGRLCFREQVTDEEEKGGIFMPIEGNFGIWANTNNPDVLKCVSTWLQNKNFGERKAQTICERNALKRHPALSVKIQNLKGQDKKRTGDITVVGWQHDHSRQELEEMAYAADAGEEVTIDGQKAEYVDSTGEVSEEDVAASQEIDEEMDRVRETGDELDSASEGKGLF